MDGFRFFFRKGGLEDLRDIFVVFWGGGGVLRFLFLIILLCDFNKFEFFRGGIFVVYVLLFFYNNDIFNIGEDSFVLLFDNIIVCKELELVGIIR